MRGGHNNIVWGKIQRDRAVVQQNGICPYCNMRLTRLEATREHVVPRSKGGSDADENIIAVHRLCNRAKGSMSRARFKKLVNGDGYSGRFHIDLIRVLRRIERATKRAVREIEQCVS